MDQRLQTIQDEYIRDLKKELPKVKKWWKARLNQNEEKSYPGKMVVDFELRWPTGMSGHPRLIEIFRRHFLAAEAVNLEIDAAGRQYKDDLVEEPWGVDTEPPSREQVSPIDLLVNDLAGEHDELHRVMRRMRLIPVGMKKGDVI